MYSLLPVACCLLPVAFQGFRYPNLNAEQLNSYGGCYT
ncbi:hypothetical protein MC7420_3673 [Coleofasciculus chthonoplastes PCC 7420]|uniref:Uncharacterized protein n=1 Tax=Coleofasciculus chthonoplastes PCC 7420 TaxID=118168 RepID=B4VWW0_9CYAN|nr:hypothetical protein MC7420_3673 [Coleofasciculus chthonoplastes PCC 7420]